LRRNRSRRPGRHGVALELAAELGAVLTGLAGEGDGDVGEVAAVGSPEVDRPADADRSLAELAELAELDGLGEVSAGAVGRGRGSDGVVRTVDAGRTRKYSTSTTTNTTERTSVDGRAVTWADHHPRISRCRSVRRCRPRAPP